MMIMPFHIDTCKSWLLLRENELQKFPGSFYTRVHQDKMHTPDTGRAGAAAKLLPPAGNVNPAFCAASRAAFLAPRSIVFAADATESGPYPYSMHVGQA